ncbi:hypothetical protein EDB19DRAFT_2030440 [Suillus lakei]|nr:hypothetical protein EDB19DRAFT_2030440 [Suillus lakei]
MTSHSYLSMVETSCPSHLQVVKRVGHELKFKAGFFSLAEELHFYILGFLPCRDILRCTSVCKALRQMYMSSSELQYIVELSGQQLLVPIPSTDNHTPISERLQLLRDKAHAWFKFNLHSFEIVTIPKEPFYVDEIVTHGHLCLWNDDLAVIIPILPKPSQHTVEHDQWQRTLSSVTSVPHSYKLDVFMDPAQNLIAVAHVVDEIIYIDIRTLDDDGVHPRAAGRRLFLSVLRGYEEHDMNDSTNLQVFGRHIAFRRTSLSFDCWQLQIWDWQHSMTSNCFLSGDLTDAIDFCFLGNNRLLVLGDTLKLYSIDDMSRMPQFLACFLMPIPLLSTRCLLPMEPQTQTQQTYTSDPEHRLLCMTTYVEEEFSDTYVYIISTKIFFDLDGTAVATPIPWKRWGPSNSRIFKHAGECKVHLSGNRVLQAFPVGTPDLGPVDYILHMMDFSPLAMTNRRGLGRVVKEPSTIDINDFTDGSQESLITSLPYVEVVSNREFHVGELEDIWIDKDRIYLLNTNYKPGRSFEFSRKLEVIDV